MEVWKDMKGFEGFYQVSNEGKGKSLDRVVEMNNKWGTKTKVLKKGKLLIPHSYPNGYLFFSLSVNGKRYQESVHRAVAKAFIPNPQNLLEVNHKDEDKTNNCVENLEWCNHSYNNLNQITNEKLRNALRNSEKAKKAREKAVAAAAKITRKKVYMYSIDKKLKATYDSTLDAAKENNCFPQNISRCCLGKIKTYKGHIWSYEPL